MTAPSPQPTILVVDDERESRDAAGDLLAHAGFNVLFAANGSEALKTVERYKVDLIVLDLMMPVMDGVTAIRRLRTDTLTARVPILAITGDPGPVLREDTIAAGCDAYVVKPVNPGAFISQVKRLLPA